jgi:uncharacterized protein YkwD
MPHRAATVLILATLFLGGCLDSGANSSSSDPADGTTDPTDGTTDPADGTPPPPEDTPPPVIGPGEPCPEGEERTRILDLVNEARSQPRLCGNTPFPAVAALAWNCLLEQAALGHSIDMGDVNFFSHTGSDGLGPGERITQAGYDWQAWGENISAGRQTAEATIQGWLDSPGHCANIMSADYTEFGAGVHRDTGGRRYWTLVLAAPRD